MPTPIPPTATCPVCGGGAFQQVRILWPALIIGWDLTEGEEATIERQQGVHCMGCGCNLRAMALGEALKQKLGGGPLIEAVAWWGSQGDKLGRVDLLEVNEAGALAPILAKLPGHVRGSWPAVDLRALPYPDARFDVVVHSDTLEHIPTRAVGALQRDGKSEPLYGPSGFMEALRECHRVLRPGGALCFTVPTLHRKLTRSTAGRPPTYHDPSPAPDEGLRVHTEFGADVWTYCLDAGFNRVEFTCIEWPAGLAITAWRNP